MNLSRRTLLRGATSGAFMASVAPGLRVALAAEGTSSSDILIVMFLRGGSDGLQLVAPADDGNYQDLRPTIAVSSSGANPGLPLGSLDGTSMFLNPSAPGLADLYNAGDLSIVHAVGLPTDNRSHFKSMDLMERGVADNEPNLINGWLTRHLNSLGGERPLLGTVSSSSSNPLSLLTYSDAIAIPDVTNFNVTGGNANADLIAALTSGNSAYEQVAQKTLQAISTVQSGLGTLAETDTDDEETVVYPGGPLGGALKSLATLIKMDVGLDLATVDQGGWDHHDNLTNEFSQRASELSGALAAFWADMADYRDRITLVTMTEFGRRVKENASSGTDHGSASTMLVLSGSANGGQVYGQWPGLAAQNLDNGDLAVTTDYRHVLSELIVKRHGSTDPQSVFPTLAYSPLGVVAGDDSLVASPVAAANATPAG